MAVSKQVIEALRQQEKIMKAVQREFSLDELQNYAKDHRVPVNEVIDMGIQAGAMPMPEPNISLRENVVHDYGSRGEPLTFAAMQQQNAELLKQLVDMQRQMMKLNDRITEMHMTPNEKDLYIEDLKKKIGKLTAAVFDGRPQHTHPFVTPAMVTAGMQAMIACPRNSHMQDVCRKVFEAMAAEAIPF